MNIRFDTCYMWSSAWTFEPPHGVPSSGFDIYKHVSRLSEIPEEMFREREEDNLPDGAWPTAFTDWMENTFPNARICHYCGSGLERCSFCLWDNEDDEFDSRIEGLRAQEWHYDVGATPDVVDLWSCHTCAYWQWCEQFDNRGMHGLAASSVLEKFKPTAPEGTLSELSQHLLRNPALWHQLTPKGMEQLVAAVFRANHGHADVIHVGRPGDGGVDAIFIEANGKRRLISVKRREKPEHVEGVETVRSLLGTLVVENEVRGIVASNADHFSHQAQRVAKVVSDRGTFTIELLDRGKLSRMLGPVLPDRPWQRYLRGRGLPEVLVKRFLSETTSHRQGTLFD